MVNIAVFAAFSFCIKGVLLSNAEFKPLCAIQPLDIPHYGWQKRQDRGKKRQQSGKGWQGRRQKRQGWEGSRPRRGHSHATLPVTPVTDCQSVSRVYATRYADVQVPAAHGDAAMVELIYHKTRRVSRRYGSASTWVLGYLIWKRAGGEDFSSPGRGIFRATAHARDARHAPLAGLDQCGGRARRAPPPHAHESPRSPHGRLA